MSALVDGDGWCVAASPHGGTFSARTRTLDVRCAGTAPDLPSFASTTTTARLVMDPVTSAYRLLVSRPEAVNATTRTARQRFLAPPEAIARLEAVRAALGLDDARFSLALGYAEGTYGVARRSGEVPLVMYQSALYLERRDVDLLVTVRADGTATATALPVASRRLTLDGRTYRLVEA